MTAPERPPCRTPAAPRTQAGYSLVEVVIAAGLLMLIMLGILPIFARSAISNAVGADSTRISNFTKSRTEHLQQVLFDDEDVTLVSGESSKVSEEYWDESQDRFTDTAPSTGTARWLRRTQIRQFSISDLEDGAYSDDEALPGGTDPGNVHFKEVFVELESNPFGPVPGRTLEIRVLKPF